MLADTWLLISLRWRLGWNTFRGRRLSLKIFGVLGMGALIFFMVGFSGAIGFGAGALLKRFSAQEFEPLMPGLILTAITLLLLVSSFGVALGSLFLSNDLDLLMTAPVSRRAVFISKILDGMASYYLMAMIGAIPALVTYGFGLGYGPFYYALALITVLGTPLLPAGLGALLVMLVARFAPARRVREVLGFAAALFGVTCSLLGNFPRLFFRSNIERSVSIGDLLATAERFADLPIPSLMAGKGLAAAGMGDLVGALVNLSLFLLINFGGFALCVWLADYLYATGWVRMQSSGSANRSKDRAAKAARNSGLLGGAAPALALALKDWRVIPRDLRNFAQFLSPLFFLPFLYLNFFGRRDDGFNALDQANTFGRGLIDFTNIFVVAGIAMTAVLVFNRIAATSLSMEGKSYWLIKTAPISGYEFLFGKFLMATIPFVILSTLMYIGVAIWREFTIFGAIYGWFGMMLLGAGAMAIEVGMAVPWANLNWDDPRRMHSGWGAFIAFGASIVMSVTGGLFLALPLITRLFLPDWEFVAWAVGPVLAIVLTVAIAGLMVWIGLKRLPYVGEA